MSDMTVEVLENRLKGCEDDISQLEREDRGFRERLVEVEKRLIVIQEISQEVKTLASEFRETKEVVAGLSVELRGVREQGSSVKEMSDKIFSLLSAREEADLADKTSWRELRGKLTKWYMWIVYLIILGILQHFGLLAPIRDFIVGG